MTSISELAHECGAVSYTPGVMRAVRGVSLTFEQLETFAARLRAAPSDSADHFVDANKMVQSAEAGVVPAPFRVGNTYRTQAGKWVRFVDVHSEGTSYETMEDEHGVNRYTRRDFGRVTGTAHDYSDPRNTPPLFAAAPASTAHAPLPASLLFSGRMALAARHGMKVTPEFNALVRDAIGTYLQVNGLALAEKRERGDKP